MIALPAFVLCRLCFVRTRQCGFDVLLCHCLLLLIAGALVSRVTARGGAGLSRGAELAVVLFRQYCVDGMLAIDERFHGPFSGLD